MPLNTISHFISRIFPDKRQTPELQDTYNIQEILACPMAPRIFPISLPTTSIRSFAESSGIGQPNPRVEVPRGLHQRFKRIHVDLFYTAEPRPVTQPVISDLPPFEGHMWGAVDDYTESANEKQIIHFVDSTASATQPPSRSITITTERGETIPIFPRSGSEFVTVGDVQRVVVAWMRIVEKGAWLQGQRAGLSETMIVNSHLGCPIEVDVWMWRGLVNEGEGVWSIRF
ncbi:hypothetical protein NP233_g10148 [Leucocoprinus birnbaumii]|uniref:Uncharacterized protein n=1 Tax=Leucocoprinus birnbaumii TaxID=56174 RepID=A0AAD5VPS3_9AGAR|nr:hypothetical protein NP233_g10148 [Leucocoprinus birnbaumii]